MSRIILAIRCFFRILFDRELASRIEEVMVSEARPSLEILAALQRDGRLIDFHQHAFQRLIIISRQNRVSRQIVCPRFDPWFGLFITQKDVRW